MIEQPQENLEMGSDIDPQTGNFISKPENIVTPEERERIVKDSDRILNDLGLSLEDLSGKRTLDIGSGRRALEIRAKMEGVDAEIVSLDVQKRQLSAHSESGRKAVVGEASHLPFLEKSFDMVLSSNGPLSMGPNSEHGVELLEEALRVLNASGEVRVSKPFGGEGGIGEYCYSLFGGDPGVKQEVDHLADVASGHKQIDQQSLERDESGCILPVGDGIFVWFAYSSHLPPERQEEIYKELTKIMESKLSTHVTTTLINPHPEYPVYWPTMILRKQ